MMKRTRPGLRLIGSVIAMCICFTLSPDLFGQDVLEQPKESQSIAPGVSQEFGQEGFGSVLFKTVLSLGVVIALVYFTTFGLKRFLTRKRGSGGASIQVLGSTLLGPKKGIYIIEVEKRRLLLGVTEATISYLTELEEPDVKALDRGGNAGSGPGTGSSAVSGTGNQTVGNAFKDFFDGFLKRRGGDAK